MTHAMERMTKWSLTPEIVGETLLDPEEVLVGHHSRFIAHRCYGHHILRAVYEYTNLIPALITNTVWHDICLTLSDDFNDTFCERF